MVKTGYKQTEIGVIPEDWEVVTIRDLINLLTDYDANGSFASVAENVKVYNYSEYAWYVRSTDLENKTDLSNVKYVDRSSYEFLKKTSLYGGELLFLKRGEIGNVYLFKMKTKNATLAPNLYLLKLNDKSSSQFLYQYFKSEKGQKQLKNKNAGSTLGALYKDDVKAMLVPLPPHPEQEAIAEALSDADAWIENLEQLIAKKRLIKQGAMQELLTPKDDWEVKKLGEIGECLRGVSYSGDSDLFEAECDKSIKLLRSNNIFNSKVVLSNVQHVSKAKVKEQQIIRGSDILICMANGSKELVGKAGFCHGYFDSNKYTFGAFMGTFRIFGNANPYFIYLNFLSKNYRNFIDLLLSGSSINNLKPSDIEQIVIPFPPLNEQTRIATILSDMDTELEALEQQLHKARQIKQGMMQELLTGRVRLV